MRNRYQAKHVDRKGSVKNEVHVALEKVGKSVLAFALACLLFPASSLAFDGTFGGGAEPSSASESGSTNASDGESAPISVSYDQDEADETLSNQAQIQSGAEEEEGKADTASKDGDNSRSTQSPTETAKPIDRKESAIRIFDAESSGSGKPTIEFSLVKGENDGAKLDSNEDGKYYSNKPVEFTVNVMDLAKDDKVAITASGGYSSLATEDKTIGESDGTSFSKSAVLAAGADGKDISYSGSVKVTVTRAEGEAGETVTNEEFVKDVVIDVTDPKVESFKFESSAIAVEEGSESNHTAYFFLNEDSPKITLSATLAEANLDDETLSKALDIAGLANSEKVPKEATWTRSDSESDKYVLSAEFEAENFVEKAADKLLFATACINITDKAGNSTVAYPILEYNDGSKSIELKKDDRFTSDNALFNRLSDSLEVTPVFEYGDGSTATSPSSSPLPSKFKDSVRLKALALDGELTSSEFFSSNRYTLMTSVSGEEKSQEGTYDSEAHTLTLTDEVLFPADIDEPLEPKTYSGNRLVVSSAHGATCSVSLPDVVIDNTKPIISAEMNQASGEGIVNDNNHLIYNSANKPVFTVVIDNPSTLTSTNDVKLRFTDHSTTSTDGITIKGSDVMWESQESTSDNKSWVGTVAVDVTSGAGSLFKSNTSYSLDTVTAETIFDDTVAIDTPESEYLPRFFYVDSVAPIITISFANVVKASVNKDGGSVVKVIISKLLADSKGGITVTAEDATFDKNNSEITLEGPDTRKWSSWVKDEGSSSLYSITIPYADLSNHDVSDLTLKVKACDLAGNENTYTYAESESAPNKTLVNDEEFALGDEGDRRFDIDTTSVKFESFELYADEDCTLKISEPNKTIGNVAYYDYPRVFGKLTVSDKNFSKVLSSVVLYEGENPLGDDLNGEDWVTAGADQYYVMHEFSEGNNYSLSLKANDLTAGDTRQDLHNDTTEVASTDILGNNIGSFTVDNSPPDVSVEIEQSPLEDTRWMPNTDWFANTVTAKVTVKDANLDGSTPLATPVCSTDRTLTQIKASGWKSGVEAGTLQCEVVFEDNKFNAESFETYGLEVKVADVLGHETAYVYGDNNDKVSGGALSTMVRDRVAAVTKTTKRSLIVDTVAPDVAVAFDKPRSSQASGIDGDKTVSVDYYADEVTATVKVTDVHFNQSKVSIVGSGKTDLPLDSDWKSGGDGAWTATVTFRDTETESLYALDVFASDVIYALDSSPEHELGHGTSYKYGDNAQSNDRSMSGSLTTTARGDELDSSFGARFVIDTVKPDVSITFEQAVAVHDDDSRTDYFVDLDKANALVATVTVVDAHFDAKQSKLNSDFGEVLSSWTQDQNSPQVYTAQVQYKDTPFGSKAGLEVVAIDKTGAADRAVSYSYGGAAVSDNPKGGNVSTTAAGKPVEGTSFIVDTIQPEISLSIKPADKQSVKTGETTTDYFPSSVIATFVVSDINFDPNTSYIDTVNEHGERVRINPGTNGWKLEDSKRGSYSYDYTFKEDNDFGMAYTFTVFAYDKAYSENDERHASDKSYSDVAGAGDRFVIDTVVPRIDTVIDQELVGSEGGVDYYGTVGENNSLTATVTVTDNNFNAEAVISPKNGTVIARDGATWTQVVEDGKAQPKWTATIEFSETPLDDTCNLGVITADDYAGQSTSYAYGSNEAGLTSTATNHGSGESETVVGESFVVDVTAPVLTVEFKNVQGESLKPSWVDEESGIAYYQRRPTAHITVRDRNFDSDLANSLLAAIGCADANALSWTRGDDEGGNAVWTAVIPFIENLNGNDVATSALSVSAVDKVYVLASKNDTASAKNEQWFAHRATWIHSDSVAGASVFVADEALPVINVSVDQQVKGTEDSADYYNADVTATVTVKDRIGHLDTSASVADADGKAIPGIEVVVLKDGQVRSDVSVSDWTVGDEDADHNVTWTGTIPFTDEDCTHSFTVAVLDKALNGANSSYREANAQRSTSFVVDKTNPAVEFSFDKPKRDTDSAGVDYFSETVKATVTVVDDNFKSTDTTVIVDGAGRRDVTWANPKSDGKTWQTVIDFGEGNGHTLTAVAVDWASRSTEMAYGTPVESGGNTKIGGSVDSAGMPLLGGSFTVDLTAPVVSYQVDQKKSATHNQVDYFSNIETEAKQATITVTVNELNFNPNSSLNVVTKNGNVEQDVVWTNTRSTIWTTQVPFDEGAGNTLDVTVGDWAKNARSLAYGASTSDSDGSELVSPSFTVDLTAPVIVSASTNKDYSGSYDTDYYFWNKKTNLTIKVTDNLGLRSVSLVDADDYYGYYYVASDTRQGALEQDIVVALADGHEFDRDIQLETIDLANNSRTWAISPKDGQVRDVTGSSRANATVVDNAHPKGLIRDTVKPKAKFSGVDSGAYYNTTQTVTFDVDELNFRYLKSYDAKQRVITVEKTAGNAEGTTNSWDVPVGDFSVVNKDQEPAGLDGLYRYAEDFGNDGHYTLTATLADPAGNTVSTEQGEFTIDKTPPTVHVEFDNNNVRNGRYYDAGRTATVTVTEHNFNASLIDISTTGSTGSWTDDGDTHTVTVDFRGDGVHDLSISGRDLAGNELDPYSIEGFTVDTTAPTISISFLGADNSEQRAFNNVVQPVISFADEANYDSNGISFSITGNKAGNVTEVVDVDYGFSRSGGNGGETITYDDFEHIIEVDDIYTITATLTDMAGNRAAEATETFSVNRFGSNYIVESPVGQSGSSSDLGYLAEAPDIMIREINVSGLTENTVAVTYNLKTTNLKRQSAVDEPGYTVRDVSNENSYGWQELDYLISKKSFAAESDDQSPDGNYVVVLSSKDDVGNTNSSANFWVAKDDERKSADTGQEETDTEKRMSAAVKFTLDTTPPDVFGLNISDRDVISAAGDKEVSFIATDNIGFDGKNGVSVVVDGRPVEHEIDGGGKVTFKVPEAPFRYQPIEIAVSDFAANSRSYGKGEDPVPVLSVKVTNDFYDLYQPFIIGGGIAIVAAVGASGVLFVRPRLAAKAAAKAAEE